MTEANDNNSPAKLISEKTNEEIAIGAEMVVGRSEDCDFTVDSRGLSRQHAKFCYQDGVLVLEDLKSTNGSFVNDRKITEPTTLKNGDVISFEEVKYKVVLPVANTLEEEDLDSKTVVAQMPEGWWAVSDEESEDMTRAISTKDLQKNMPTLNHKLNEALTGLGDKPCLVCLTGDTAGKVFRFNPTKASNKWEIGKSADCDVQVDEEGLSGNHAQILNEGERWKLVDLMSTNGSFVNGQKTLSSYLSSGDTIRLGEVQFKFHNGESGALSEENASSAGTKSAQKDAKTNTLLVPVATFVVTLCVLMAMYFLFLK